MDGESKKRVGWCQLRVRTEVRAALLSVTVGKESYGDVIMALIAHYKASRGEWASTGAPHPTEAVRADSRRDPQPEAPKDAGVQGPVVKAGTCICCGAPAMECPYAKGTNGERYWKPQCQPCYDDPHNAISECEHGKGAGP